ncbi:MAG TPA: VWA domain-containing protein [Pyrinomonadaceae bacterium]|nr:VWA domain-containing protein [Pyrinomonadaceae bacterium]
MRLGIFQFCRARRSAFIAIAGFLAAASLLIAGATSAQQPDSRARQTGAATPSPTATPTQTGPGRRIAPQLGAPPPPPILKPKPTPTPDANSAEIDEGSRLTINTELVTLHVRVIDRNNHPVNRLVKDDFRILEDGAAQPIFSFTEEEVPVIYGLAVDTSGSVRPQFQQIIDAAKTIINSNKKGDETFIERFISSDKIETVQDFTPSKDLLMDGLDTLYVEGGQTAVVDGVYLAAEHVAQYQKGPEDDRRRRALIVVTDGEDRASYYPETQLFQNLREEDVQIFVIGFVNELDAEKGLIRKSPRDKAVNLINKLASETGGRAFFPQSISELPQIANEIVRDLRTQYVISYDPTNKAHDGTFRSIKVTVTQPVNGDHRIALTRSGRTAGQGTTASKPAPPATKTNQQPNNQPRRPR